MRKLSRPQVLLLAALLGAAPAAADWLVTRDGGQIETRGPWKVDGSRVLFTLPNGTLSSLRASEVDLDQSALATARAIEVATAPPAPAPKREPVLRLTEKELPPVKETEEVTAPEAKTAEADSSGLDVVSWEKTATASGDGVEIFGTIRNGGTSTITSPTLLVMLYGEDGGLLATNEGTINAGIVQVGKSVNFRVAFPGIPDFAAVKFDVRGRGFRAQPAAAEGEEGAAGTEAPAEQPIENPEAETPPPSA